jgi:hypothetical protein
VTGGGGKKRRGRDDKVNDDHVVLIVVVGGGDGDGGGGDVLCVAYVNGLHTVHLQAEDFGSFHAYNKTHKLLSAGRYLRFVGLKIKLEQTCVVRSLMYVSTKCSDRCSRACPRTCAETEIQHQNGVSPSRMGGGAGGANTLLKATLLTFESLNVSRPLTTSYLHRKLL